jgi:hypothetical protein
MNDDFRELKEILETLREDYIRWTSGEAIDPISPVTERSLVAEIYSRMKDYCQSRNLQVQSEMKPAPSENTSLDDLKNLPRIDVAILADRNGESWLDSAIKIQDRYAKGKIEARFSSVPIRFWNTAVEVKIQSNVANCKKDIDKLREISGKNELCNCFFVLLNARGQRCDHEQIALYAEQWQITLIEYTGEKADAGKEVTKKTSHTRLRTAKDKNSGCSSSGTIWAAWYSGKSLDEILQTNPFAIPSWLEQSGSLTQHRKDQIDLLFKGSTRLSRDYIRSLSKNDGSYLAFLAVAGGLAQWDANTQEVVLLG